MKVKLLDGNTILMNAKDNFAIIKWLMAQDDEIHYSQDVNVFMKKYANRKATLENTIIRCDYVDDFIEDLVLNKIIQIIK